MLRSILLSSLIAVGMSSCTVTMIATAPTASSALASPPVVAEAL
jgi:hypothetical protein